MVKIDKNSLGYLGIDYQLRLMAQILTDNRFANSIIDIVDANYFEDPYLRAIASVITEAHQKDDIIPDIKSIEFRILDGVNDEQQRRFILTQLKKVQEANLNDTIKVQDIAMKFCKQQELKKSLKQINKIIEKGDLDDYEECESILRKALDHGDNRDDSIHVFDDISSVLKSDFRKPIRTGIGGLDGIMDGGLSKGELAVILAPYGVGKSLANSNKVYTPDGYKLMGDLKIDDFVIARNGEKTKVLGVYPQGIRDMYKVVFNDGTSTTCDKEHLWAVNDINQRNRSSWKDGKRIKLEPDHSFKVVKTSDFMDNLTYGSMKKLRYKIPLVEPVAFNEKEVSIHPYVLGVLLGDGNMSSSRVTTKDKQLIEELKKFSEISIIERCREFENGDTLVLRCLDNITILGVADKLRILGLRNALSDDKFIPKEYLYNSVKNRVLLLQGLMDTDGYCSKSGRTQFCTVSKQLSLDVKELVLSLGGFCNSKTKPPTYTYKGVKKEGKLAYILTISFPKGLNIEPFKLIRKLERVKNRVKYSDNKFIKSVEFSHREEATCIMVDNDEHLFVTDDFIVTHNTTMMTKVANTAMFDGYKVLQIFFEDTIKVIQRKHLACWSGYKLNDLSLHEDELLLKLDEFDFDIKNKGGNLKLKKFSSDGTTIPIIKQYVRKQIASGFKPDLIILDYIDVVEPSRKFDDVNAGEGSVMRQFESMLSELDIAGWTAVQGNRQSIGAEVVQGHQMGGSIKKAQIGHFIVSIAKTLDQQEDNTATMAILKSRFGKSGMIFTDIKFDNSRIQIEMDITVEPKSASEYKKDVTQTNQIKLNQLFDARNALKELPTE